MSYAMKVIKKLRKLLSGLKHRLLGARYKVVDGALAGRGRRHLLFLPAGSAYPAELTQIKENSPLPQS